MDLSIPIRGKLLAEIPLFIKVEPLQRPRLNRHSKHIYQPKKNQAFLMDELSNYCIATIEEPVIIDTYINFINRNKTPYDHPVTSQYGDEDNLRKGINDALVIKEIIKDDLLVVGGENYKAFSTEDVVLIRIYIAKKDLI